ncbi:endonuclease Q family protein [Thermoactinomyces mirandus]|uniref:TIGR00375 family protein n=1 Tax=Thermoactinomyces mirandus TaxID=2756294 RepID=A0A7W2APG9_9BACL|nr:endonuclease Q family protein [Thermoactinomyces mirandus]MBA4600949.1 TIGR00375 family protein [Thermoactinomyces mirandus]
MTLKKIYADFHIHIGRTSHNLPVKITAARNLTFENIVKEAHHCKGLGMIGVIDAQSPPVQEDIIKGLESGLYKEHPDGGIIYGKTTCLLGAEIEIREPGLGPAHVLVYLKTLAQMQQFTDWCRKSMKNIRLSTQRLYQPVRALQEKVWELDGIFIPAHVFTPFKSIYGSATDKMGKLLDLEKVSAVELGLSSDTDLADRLSELSRFPFVTNSDAHSLPKIGREYNEILVIEPSFEEFRRALKGVNGRKIVANCGLNPKLGKYYRSRCLKCDSIWPENEPERCPGCGSTRMVKGVYDRILELSDQPCQHPHFRPPYRYQVPLEFIPKLGKKTLDKLLLAFGTEMNVLNQVPIERIAEVAGEGIAHQIWLAREERLEFVEGGGGIYGRVKTAGYSAKGS